MNWFFISLSGYTFVLYFHVFGINYIKQTIKTGKFLSDANFWEATEKEYINKNSTIIVC